MKYILIMMNTKTGKQFSNDKENYFIHSEKERPYTKYRIQ